MTGLDSARDTANVSDRSDQERCPVCGQLIPHEKFQEIHERIVANERKRSVEFDRRLEEQVGREKALADANAKAQIAKARKEAASAVENAKRVAEAKLRAAGEAARKATEATLKPKLEEAQKSKKAAEKRLETLATSQQTVLNRRLQEQRIALEKDKAAAVNAEKSKIFNEKLRLEQKLQLMERQLQNKTAGELGEGAEIDLFEALRGRFPQDEITRVGKGNEGADIIHKVVDGHRVCGSIVYDSKNRNAWRSDYVSKLRRDQLAAKADHAVLATRVFPAGTRQLHTQDGVIVANPARALVIVEMLRKHIVQVHTLRLSAESRHDKMVTLYEFITSERCAQLMEQIETQTDDMLEIDVSEKKAHDSTWKRRGELIRSVQKIQVELSTEIDRIVGAPAVAPAAQAT